MASRKYTGDYRVEPHLCPNGKIKDVPIYCGDYFRFARAPEKVRRSLWTAVLFHLLLSVMLLLPLCFPCSYARQFYIVIPMLVAMIPAVLLWAGLWRLWRVKAPVTREYRDKSAGRIEWCSTFQLVVSAVSVVSSVVFVVLCEKTLLDWLFSGLSVLRLLLSLPIYFRRCIFEMVLSEEKPAS